MRSRRNGCPPTECAELLVSQIAFRAEQNGVDWAILTEHGPWLGIGPLVVCIFDLVCQDVLWGDYVEDQASEAWNELAGHATIHNEDHPDGVRLLAGQEMGTAAAISQFLDHLVPSLLDCGTSNAGHFGVYFAQSIIHESAFDCEEGSILEAVRDTVYGGDRHAWGGVNHPDNHDGGSQWHCWFPDVVYPLGGLSPCNTNIDPADVVTVFDVANRFDQPNRDAAFRSMEAISGNNQPSKLTLAAWDLLLSSGARVAAVGGSDVHTMRREKAGLGAPGNEARIGLEGRTLAYAPDGLRPDLVPGGSSNYDDPIRQAISGGHTVATNGPSVLASIEGVLPGESGLVARNPIVHVNWDSTFRVLKEGFENEDYQPENSDSPAWILNVNEGLHGPDKIRVVWGEVGSQPPTATSPSAISADDFLQAAQDRTDSMFVSLTDGQKADGEIDIEIPGGLLNSPAWVRVEAYYDRLDYAPDADDPSYTPDPTDFTYSPTAEDLVRYPSGLRGAWDYFAFTSPIYIEQTAIENLDACGGGAIHRTDDDSVGPIALPFTANFYGALYDFVWVNNNGTLTFNDASGKFTAFEIDESIAPMIAPFFADVDTRPYESGRVYYGSQDSPTGPAVFCAQWDGVGYHDEHTDLLNRFQVLLFDRSDIAPGDFDIVFNYAETGWETGDLSGGSGGFGGTPAGVGYSAGDGDPEHYWRFRFERGWVI